ncbi:MAG: acetyl-CoA carboxylase biotin carboxyl carrier protein [Candidatus Omnitrophica bacterium]|nr:acetyl-CoA carboxylase biotin carboxyl carrier protein [Candidatus Omnitrophota bacterium]
MNIKEIKEMLSLMNENNLVELEIEKDGMRIRLKKGIPGGEAIAQPVVIQQEKIVTSQQTQTAETKTQEKTVRTIEIKAPMVGTFYRAPSPESPPYVEVGQIIEAGQVVCIIEAMKLMNEIKSEVRGRLLEILVDNGEPVEFGQSMFIVEPL